MRYPQVLRFASQHRQLQLSPRPARACEGLTSRLALSEKMSMCISTRRCVGSVTLVRPPVGA